MARAGAEEAGACGIQSSHGGGFHWWEGRGSYWNRLGRGKEDAGVGECVGLRS